MSLPPKERDELLLRLAHLVYRLRLRSPATPAERETWAECRDKLRRFWEEAQHDVG